MEHIHYQIHKLFHYQCSIVVSWIYLLWSPILNRGPENLLKSRQKKTREIKESLSWKILKLISRDFFGLKNFLAHCAWFNDWFRGLCDSISLLPWNSSSYFNFCSFLQFVEIFVPIYRNSNRLGCKKSIKNNQKTTKFTLLEKRRFMVDLCKFIFP